MSAKRKDAPLRRLRYRIDGGHRSDRRRQSYRARGRDTYVRKHRDSWPIMELCEVLGVSVWTIRRFEKMGVIPKPTYPSRYRRYWGNQAVLLIWLFESMRMEGWPRRMPWFKGSRYWTLALTRLHTEWHKETHSEGGWEVGNGVHHEDGEDASGEHDSAPDGGGESV